MVILCEGGVIRRGGGRGRTLVRGAGGGLCGPWMTNGGGLGGDALRWLAGCWLLGSTPEPNAGTCCYFARLFQLPRTRGIPRQRHAALAGLVSSPRSRPRNSEAFICSQSSRCSQGAPRKRRMPFAAFHLFFSLLKLHLQRPPPSCPPDQ
jgi:hypothetical protein